MNKLEMEITPQFSVQRSMNKGNGLIVSKIIIVMTGYVIYGLVHY